MSYNTLPEAVAFDAALTLAHLTDATIYINARYGSLWGGKLADTTQAEDWGRVNHDGTVLLDANGRELIGIPPEVKRAELEAAVMIKDGEELLPTTVATATSVSATAGGTLIHDEVGVGSLKTIQKFSAASSESSTGTTVQEIDSNGYAIIKLLDAILYPLITGTRIGSANNFYFARA